MDYFTERRPPRGFLEQEINIGQRRAPGEAWPHQAGPWRGLPFGRASWLPGQGVAPLLPYFGVLESSVALIFYMIFPDFSEHFNNWHFPAMHGQQQTETGTRALS